MPREPNECYAGSKRVRSVNKPKTKVVRYFMAVGLIVACLLYPIGMALRPLSSDGFGMLFLLLWPTSILLMSGEGGGTVSQIIAFVISAGANVAVYALVGVPYGQNITTRWDFSTAFGFQIAERKSKIIASRCTIYCGMVRLLVLSTIATRTSE
jgi:hypothetical protein